MVARKNHDPAVRLLEPGKDVPRCARGRSPRRFAKIAAAWLERIAPGTHRRIKGLRLVAAYGIAAMLGTMLAGSYGLSSGALLGYLAAGFALWASVSEG